MNGLSTEKINNRKNLLSFVVLIAVAVFSVNLSLVTDTVLFVLFYVLTATASAWLSSAKGTLLSLTASLVGWAVSLWISENAVCSLLSLSYLPFSLAIPYIGRGKLSRSVAIGIGSGTVTLGTVATLIYVTYVRIGTVSLSAIRNSFPFFFNRISEVLYESFFVDIAGSKIALIAESNVNSYLNVIICLIPAIISAVLSLIGFVIAWLHRKMVENTAVADFEEKAWNIVPSPLTAILFIVALITAQLFDDFGIVSLTALNVFIIFLPIILLTGLLTSLSPKITNGIPRPRLFRPLTLIISVFNGIVPFASLCIFYGLYDSFRASMPKRKPNNQE